MELSEIPAVPANNTIIRSVEPSLAFDSSSVAFMAPCNTSAKTHTLQVIISKQLGY